MSGLHFNVSSTFLVKKNHKLEGGLVDSLPFLETAAFCGTHLKTINMLSA